MNSTFHSHQIRSCCYLKDNIAIQVYNMHKYKLSPRFQFGLGSSMTTISLDFRIFNPTHRYMNGSKKTQPTETKKRPMKLNYIIHTKTNVKIGPFWL